jgi:hypothetical protein
MTVHVPMEAGSAVEVVAAAEGGSFVLDVVRPEGAAGVVVVRVHGQEEGVVMTAGQLAVDADGRVRLTLEEYIQAGAAFKAVAEMAEAVFARLASLEARCQCGTAPAADPDGHMEGSESTAPGPDPDGHMEGSESTAPETGPAADETVVEGGTVLPFRGGE